MSDIKVGDYLECIKSNMEGLFTIGCKYKVHSTFMDRYYVISDEGYGCDVGISGLDLEFKKAGS